MKIFLRIIFITSAAFIGLIVIASIGGRFLVSKSAGLAGGAMVLGYGILGALVCLIVASFISFKLPLARLRIITIVMGLVALIFIILTAFNIQKINSARLDPASEYSGLPHFSITVQQTKIIDPVLSTRYTINTTERKWTSTLPDGRICQGTLSAKAHKAISQPLLNLSKDADTVIQNCLQTAQNAEKELNWKFLNPTEGIQKGQIAISQACLNEHPDMAQLLREISKANLSTTSNIKCQ